ncbi:unnamed protein product [Soboliphyme baturini]|uniref:Sushi, von Willebrand factor type A, EGF and pentraxin domain-containing protein 1 n=1 Tax=Soboliphyme baturini TaxID=241478 RepID=A0A183J0X1_9BILA|nr:unnamed protein product [Soboliphyme baturini]
MDFRFTGSPPTCELINCGEPPFLRYAIYKRLNMSDPNIFNYGSNFMFDCQLPYIATGKSSSGDRTVRCQADGTWDFGNLHCEGVECPLSEKIGTSSRPLPDTAFMSNTEIPFLGYEPHKAQMHRSGWCGREDAFIFLSIDLQKVYVLTTLRVTGVGGSGKLQGHPTRLQLFYKVAFAQNFDTYPIEFNMQSSNDNDIYSFTLNPTIRARYILLGVVEFEKNPCLRFSLAGCEFQSADATKEAKYKVGWNDTLPICVDSLPPVFQDCPEKPIYSTLDKNGQIVPVNFETPKAVDNSGKVAWIDTDPPNFQVPFFVTNDMNVTYTAYDYSGNSVKCVVQLRVPDNQPPEIICPDSYSIFVDEEIPEYHIVFNQSTVDVKAQDPSGLKEVFFSPWHATLKLREYVSVTVTAIDNFDNSNSCMFQVVLQPSPCQTWTLVAPDRSTKTCTSNPGKTGLKCTVQCQTGYRFLDNRSEKSFECSYGQEWAPSFIPIRLIAENPARFKFTASITYPISGVLNANCLKTYENVLYALMEKVGGVLSQKCSATVEVLVQTLEITTSSTSDTVSRVISNVSMQILPTVANEVFYNLCSLTLGTMFDMAIPNVAAPVAPLLNVDMEVSSGCPSLKASKTTTFSGFNCSTGEVLLNFGERLPKCVLCPPGTYRKNENDCVQCPLGTYQDESGQMKCKECPLGTTTFHHGMVNSTYCVAMCQNGTFSTTGVVPCRSCPVGTFSPTNITAGFTTCEKCQNGTFMVVAGSKSSSMCRKPCDVGEYSWSGLQPCSQCPVNYYQPNTGQVGCIECPSKTYTARPGANSSADCVPIKCDKIKCENDGDCEVLDHSIRCRCLPGFSGILCEKTENACLSQPCFNGGHCIQKKDSFTCQCPAGSYGDLCESSLNECKTVECHNGGVCHNLPGVNTFECLCRFGYTGERCDIVWNPCEGNDNLCRNGGTCKPFYFGLYKCLCPTGWSGPHCEVNIDDCAEQPCALNATCHDLVNDFSCDCPRGFTGKRCETKVDLCKPDPCRHGQCVDKMFSYYCLCKLGWTGVNCDTGIDDCASAPCHNGGTCVDRENGFECHCSSEYTGSLCQHPVDRCVGVQCLNNGTCRSGVKSFECLCEDGFYGTSFSRDC